MITYKDILFSATKILSDSFDIDVIVENSEGIFENECFYVTVVPMSSIASTKSTNEKNLMLSVKYFGGDKLKNYEIADILEGLFVRSLKVNDRFLNISSVEPNFLTDEVGDVLDFLVYLNYFDDIKQNVEEFDNIENVELIDKINIRGD